MSGKRPHRELPTSAIMYRQIEWERSGQMRQAVSAIIGEMNRRHCSATAALKKIASARLKKRRPFTAEERELYEFASIHIGIAQLEHGPNVRLKLKRRRARRSGARGL